MVTGNTPVDSIYRIANLMEGTLKDMIQKLAEIPLLYQPGTKWNYSIFNGRVRVFSGGYFWETI